MNVDGSGLALRPWSHRPLALGPWRNVGFEIDHDRCLPPLQAEGPELPFQRERDFLTYDLALHDDLALMILELPIDQSVVEAVRGCVL